MVTSQSLQEDGGAILSLLRLTRTGSILLGLKAQFQNDDSYQAFLKPHFENDDLFVVELIGSQSHVSKQLLLLLMGLPKSYVY